MKVVVNILFVMLGVLFAQYIAKKIKSDNSGLAATATFIVWVLIQIEINNLFFKIKRFDLY